MKSRIDVVDLRYSITSPRDIVFKVLTSYKYRLEDISVRCKGRDLETRFFEVENQSELNDSVKEVVILASSKNDIVVGDRVELFFDQKLFYRIKNRMLPYTSIRYKIDSVRRQNDKVIVSGWVASKSQVNISVYEKIRGQDNPLKFEIERIARQDVETEFFEVGSDNILGFELKVKGLKSDKILLKIDTNEEEIVKTIPLRQKVIKSKMKNVRRKSLKVVRTYKTTGVSGVIELFKSKLKINNQSYKSWLKKNRVTEEELNYQREHVFPVQPLISIVVPLYKTPTTFLEMLLESIINQTYSNWEICFSDGSGEKTELRVVLEEYMKKDKRIKLISSEEGALRISANTNQALEIVTGEYIAFMDHDDCLSENALFEVVKVINKHPEVDYIYSDEDKISMDGKNFFDPHFKPDFNEYLLCSNNYISHLSVVRRALVREVGGLRGEYDGAQDYDFVLRCTEKTRNFRHIPKVLYHWRMHMDSTAENPESKMYAFKAGEKAVNDHYKRIGVNAVVAQQKEIKGAYGIYSTKFEVSSTPLVSIIIPNKDHIDDLAKCIHSIEEKNTYREFEIIIVENNSTRNSTFEFYETLKEKENISVVVWEGDFNYSAINNFGVSFAKGDYLLFLNNDIELINKDSFEQMLAVCMQDRVGIVGARLLYPDNTIQHAGVIIGFAGVAGHAGSTMPVDAPGYFARQICMQEVSAVTAACMMVKRSVFRAVHGFEEDLAVAFNDIDFCLKVREKSEKIVYLPSALLYHYESKSRGKDDSSEKKERFYRETKYMKRKWKHFLEKGDPYYNVNLSLISSPYNLKFEKLNKSKKLSEYTSKGKV